MTDKKIPTGGQPVGGTAKNFAELDTPIVAQSPNGDNKQITKARAAIGDLLDGTTPDIDNSPNGRLRPESLGWQPVSAEKLAEYTPETAADNVKRGVWLDVNGVFYERKQPTNFLEAVVYEKLNAEFFQEIEDSWSDGGPDATDVDLLAALLCELDAIEGSREALETFALSNVENLAQMSKAEISEFCVALRAKGVTKEWVRVDLRPAITEERRKQKEQAQTLGDGFAGEATWRTYVAAAEGLGYRFRLNELSDTVETNGERMDDVVDAVLLSKLHEKGLKSPDVARRAFTTAAAQNPYHPVKEYLAGQKWDEKDHIEKLAEYFTDTHDPITYQNGTQRTVSHAFLQRWLVGAVAKVYDPMNAQNPMLILDGAQGSGKSYFAKWICPMPNLHFEGAIRPEDKDYLSYLTTRWIWEVSELGVTMRKSDREALKAFLTKQDASFRPAYGRYGLVKPALASFIGTVNFEGALLADTTGHRRFWPVNLAGLDWNYSQDVDVNQLWAQAYALYRQGEPWQLSTEERVAHANIVQTYEVEDILAGYVLEYFRVESGNDALFMTTTEIISILRKPEGADLKGSEKALSMQLATSLTSLGLVRKRQYVATEKAQRWGYAGITRRLPSD